MPEIFPYFIAEIPASIRNGSKIYMATQVISEKSETFQTIQKHENILDSVLKQLIGVIVDMGNR